MGLVNGLLRALDDFAWSAQRAFKNCSYDYCDLDTGDDAFTLSMRDGTLVSGFELRGSRASLNAQGLSDLVDRLRVALSPSLEAAGHGLQTIFHYDPDRTEDEARNLYRPAVESARAIGADAEWLFDEWARTQAKYCASERVFFVIYTRPAVLNRVEAKAAGAAHAKRLKEVPSGSDGQRVTNLMKEIENAHFQLRQAVKQAFVDAGLIIKEFDSRSLARAQSQLLLPELTHGTWSPYMPGDRLPIRHPDEYVGADDFTNAIYPPLSQQIWRADAEELDDYSVKVDGAIYSPVAMELGPKVPQPFQVLLRRLYRSRLPARIAFLTEGDGLGATNGLKASLASVLHFAAPSNRLYNDAVEALREAVENQQIPHARFRVTATTWVNDSGSRGADMKALAQRRQTLITALQQWGEMAVIEMPGEPLAGLAASLPACTLGAPGPVLVAPLADALVMSPLSRPASVWDNGMVFNTPDGKLYPFTIGSSEQTSWGHLTFAGMGGGKSVLENTLDYMYLFQPGVSAFPYLSCLDIGPSSKGLVDLLQEQLPPRLRRLAVYRRLINSPKDAINPFDTPLGCDKPLAKHLSFLINFVSIIATPDDKDSPGDGVAAFLEAAIKFTYEELSRSRNPRMYEPNIDVVVDEAIELAELRVHDDTTWWEIVDALFEKGAVNEAARAQRYAVPLLAEVGANARRKEVCAPYERMTRENGEPLPEYISRVCNEAITRFKVLGGPTRLDLSSARVIALDLDEVAPPGGSIAAKQTGVFYMLGRHVTSSRFFLMERDLEEMPQAYRDYHEKKIDEIRTIPKKIRYDEVHRIMRKSAVTQQVVDDLITAQRESRKWNLHIGLATQRMEDVPETVLELMTTYYILGVGSPREADVVASTLGLNSLLRGELTAMGKPAARGAKLIAKFKTAHGDLSHVLMNTLCPSLVWAFSTTTEDVKIRSALYASVGVRRALAVLSKHYPGSAKGEIEKRKVMQEDSLLPDDKRVDVIQQIIDELTILARDISLPEAA